MSFRQHLVRWEEEFGKRGLVVVEISGGKLATYEESQEAWKKYNLQHSALWDKDNRNHENYGIASWPSAYLIGPDGKVFWEGNPALLLKREKEVTKLKKLIEEKLRRVSVSAAPGASEKSRMP